MRLPRPWTKKRGNRMLADAVSGAIGEAILLAGLFLLGVFLLALMLFQRFAAPSWGAANPLAEGLVSEEASASMLGFWIVVVLSVALLAVGGGGILYRLLRINASDERRLAMAGRRRNPLGGDSRRPSPSDLVPLPTVPDGRGVTDSPGIHQTYRLASDGVNRATTVAAAAALALLWNATWFVLLAVVVSGYLTGQPRWVLTFLLLPFAGIGWWAFRLFLESIKTTAGVGATIVEINDHPLEPGETYTLFVSQAGKLRLRRLRIELVCDEQTTYRQGTDLRVDQHRAYSEILHTQRDLRIDPHHPWEQELAFQLPTDAMHSFQSAHNAVCWRITVSGDARPWPSFCQSFPVVVLPPAGPPIRHPR